MHIKHSLNIYTHSTNTDQKIIFPLIFIHNEPDNVNRFYFSVRYIYLCTVQSNTIIDIGTKFLVKT